MRSSREWASSQFQSGTVVVRTGPWEPILDARDPFSGSSWTRVPVCQANWSILLHFIVHLLLSFLPTVSGWGFENSATPWWEGFEGELIINSQNLDKNSFWTDCPQTGECTLSFLYRWPVVRRSLVIVPCSAHNGCCVTLQQQQWVWYEMNDDLLTTPLARSPIHEWSNATNGGAFNVKIEDDRLLVLLRCVVEGFHLFFVNERQR